MRVLLRNTRRYTHILSRSIQPRYLRERKERRHLIASLLKEEPLPVPSVAAGAIFEAEIEALERLDIPFFHAVGRDLVGEGRILRRNLLASGGHDEAVARLASLEQEEPTLTLSTLRLLWIMGL